MGVEEKRHGFVWLPHGPLADRALRSNLSLTGMLCRDPAHVLLLGIAPTEIYLLAAKMEKCTPYTWDTWRAWCADHHWHVAARVGQTQRNAWFSERRVQACKDSSEPKHYKGSASDVLGFHAILGLFVELKLKPLPAMALAAESFLQLSDLIGACFESRALWSTGDACTPAELDQLASRHLTTRCQVLLLKIQISIGGETNLN